MGVTNTWIAAAAGNWSDDANWSLGHSPIEGEDPTFDGTSINNCNANDPTPTGVLTIAAGYTGRVTQAATMYVSGVNKQNGRLDLSNSYHLYCSGDFIETGGSHDSAGRVHMTSDNTIISLSQLNAFEVLYVEANISCNKISVYNLNVNQNKTLTIDDTLSTHNWVTFPFLNNYGEINGNGKLEIYLRFTTNTISLTNINVDVSFIGYSGFNGNSSIKLIGSGNIKDLIIRSDHSTYTATLDLNGYDLECDSLTLGTRGILQCGEGTITTGSLDSSAGTITPETATWLFDGAGTVKTNGTDKLHSVIVKDRLQLLSDLGIEQTLAHTNPIDLNGFALTLDRPENEYTSIRRPIVRAIRKLDLGPTGALDRWMTDLGGMV